MDPRRRWAARLALVAALILAVLGQVYFFHRRAYLWDGLALHGLAALCFGLAWRWSLPARPRHPSSLAAWLEERPIPAALLAVGLGLSFTATLLSRGRTWQQATGDVVLLWSLGLLAAGLAAWFGSGGSAVGQVSNLPNVPEEGPKGLGDLRGVGSGGSGVGQVLNLPNAWRRWPGRLRHLPRRTWIEAGIVVALTLLAASLRFSALGSVPYTVGGDEAWHGLLARQVLHGELRNPFVMGYMSMPTAFYWPLSWALRLAGDSVVGLRVPAALVGSLTVPLLYLFARSLWGRRTALLAALFLAAWDYPIHYSRLGANNIWDPLFVLLALWALDRG
ncbi:MAG TPA: phospholipid carrier-dependent glycosyltransferase, partial [Anaerolineae bacterium]|nr:phospholipid carrier-dependent glycosyltransferase [Anaerolineae bacterium]